MYELLPTVSASPSTDAVAQRAALGLLVGGVFGLQAIVVQGDAGLPYLVLSAITFGALGWWTAQREERLRSQAITQPITGLSNPALFEERLRGEMLRAQRRRDALSVLVLDLGSHDRFVARGGIGAGNRLRREVANCLRRTCRATDFIVHRGTDRFLIIAPGTDATEAEAMALRLRAALAQLPNGKMLGLELAPTIGGAQLPRPAHASPEGLVEAAEQAIVIARARGRDILVLSPGRSNDEPDQGDAPMSKATDKASIRENEIVEADGTKSVELDVYCPGCKKWHAVDGRRRASWADRTLRQFSARPFLHTGGDARLSDLMDRDVICVRPDMSIEALSSLFLEKGISGAPVLDAAGNLIGAVGTNDILRNAWDPPVWDREANAADEPQVPKGFHLEPLPRATVAEVMTPIVFKLDRNASIGQAAALMAYESVPRVFVVTPDGKVEGVVSSEDVLRWVAHGAGYVVPTSKDAPPPEKPKKKLGPILVVDDDPDLRETVSELLQDAGYAVMTAANGSEALVALQLSQRPALILLDLSMPVMSGPSLCAELSKDPQLDRIPLVLLSGSEGLAGQVGRIDADAFLSKPVEASRLLGTIRRYC